MCISYVFCAVFDYWMTHDGLWCCQTIFGPPDVARVMQLIGDGERLRVAARRRNVSPIKSVDYVEVTGAFTSRQGQSCSRMTTPIQYRSLVLLSHRNHMSTARALEIDFHCAAEVHVPDQIVQYKLHYDGTRVRRPVQGPVHTA